MKMAPTSAEPDDRSRSGKGTKARLLITVLAWGAACTTIGSLLVVVLLAIALNSTEFHNYLRTTLESKGSESLGVRVQLQNFALHFSTLSVDLYGLTIS